MSKCQKDKERGIEQHHNKRVTLNGRNGQHEVPKTQRHNVNSLPVMRKLQQLRIAEDGQDIRRSAHPRREGLILYRLCLGTIQTSIGFHVVNQPKIVQ